MAAFSQRSGRRFLLQPKWLCWHVFAVVGTLGMLWLGDWQLHRALAGNDLSWAYTFEWPLFAVFGVYFWARTIRDEFRQARVAAPQGANSEAQSVAREGSFSEGSASQGCASEDSASERPASEQAASADAYVARLRAEVRGHGRWHGFR